MQFTKTLCVALFLSIAVHSLFAGLFLQKKPYHFSFGVKTPSSTPKLQIELIAGSHFSSWQKNHTNLGRPSLPRAALRTENLPPSQSHTAHSQKITEVPNDPQSTPPTLDPSHETATLSLPPYPLLSRKLREEGKVELRKIKTTKTPFTEVELEIAKSSGFVRLDQAALRHFKDLTTDELQRLPQHFALRFRLTAKNPQEKEAKSKSSSLLQP